MRICKVIKPLVSTNRIPGFEHKHLKVVQDGSSHLVAVDAVGCRDGDWVICVGSSAAREAAGSKSYPSDLTIVGIIDHWDPPQKPPASSSASAQASASSSATSQAAGAPASSSIQTPDHQTGGSGGGAG
ncbi:MAG: carboxysome peptide A [Cyanobacteria bacterium MAG CAR4_bin_6]|nr:carboxysome peptide A [Cyanobacteria bacterium MAG CAR4_bin_6]MCY4235332.1 carboxysome peptide A [Cyanobacteria bacterium MAG CAR2_bin_4]